MVIAVSGGADSVCLLDVLRRLAADCGLALHIAHFHHGLRGAAADADARFVAGLADAWQLPCTLGSGAVDLVARQRGRSLEAAAHDARWRFLERLSGQIGATAIATGHTRDDQSETVLLHLLRGSGLAGLAGLPARRGIVVRPLLAVGHADTLAWCQAHDLTWREDASNAEPWCARNRMRLEVLPFLRHYNPALDAALARTADALQADLRYLDQEVTAAWQTLRRPTVVGEQRIDLAGYRALPEALRRRVLLRWLGEHTEATHVAAADALLISGRTGATITLPGRYRLVRDYREAVLTDAEQRAAPRAITLAVPGRTEATAWGWRVLATLLPGPIAPTGGGWAIDLDAEAIRLPLVLRPRLPGDRIVLHGVAGPKKVQDVFVDAKVPQRQRDRVGILTSARGIVWLVGMRVAAWAGATPRSRTVLRIEVRPIEGGTGGR